MPDVLLVVQLVKSQLTKPLKGSEHAAFTK